MMRKTPQLPLPSLGLQPHQPAAASVPKAQLTHQVRDATRGMAGAEARVEKATTAMKAASHILDGAKQAELDAKKEQEAALKAVRVAKDRRMAYYNRAKGEPGGVSQPRLKEADEVIRKAERS